MDVAEFDFDFRPVARALKTNTSLKRFEIQVRVGDCMRNYSPGLMLDVVKHNTTLVWTNIHSHWRNKKAGKKHKDEVNYFLALNKYGRKAVRNERTPLVAFVQILANVWDTKAVEFDELGTSVGYHSDINEVFPRFGTDKLEELPVLENDQLSIVFGLLRECPGKWSSLPHADSNSSTGRKRKHGA